MSREQIIKLLDYITNLQEENERLNNIIKPKEVNYNYLKLLFEKKDKEEVIKSYTYKCEQLEKLNEEYNKQQIELMKKDNIINELEEILEYEKNDYGENISIETRNIDSEFLRGTSWEADYILSKLQELKEGK